MNKKEKIEDIVKQLGNETKLHWGKFYVKMKNAKIKKGDLNIVIIGVGITEEEAAEDLYYQILGETLILDANKPNRKEVMILRSN